jgi:hypothetical protein
MMEFEARFTEEATVEIVHSPVSHRDRAAWILPKLVLGLWVILVALAVGRGFLALSPNHAGCYHIFADAARHWQAEQDLYDRARPRSVEVFRNCPSVAVMLSPLAWLPVVWGNIALRIIGLAVLLPALWWWSRLVLAGTREAEPDLPMRRAWFFLLVAGLCNNSLMDIQLNVLTLGLLIVTVAAVARERWNLAAIACALTVCAKAYPLALGLCLAVLYPRRFAGRWVAAMACCLALPFAFGEPSYVLHQYDEWLRFGLNARYHENHFQDVQQMCLCWGAPMTRQVYQLLGAIIGSGVGLVCLVLRRRSSGERMPLLPVFAMCSAWMMAFGPATEATTYILLAPAVAAATVNAWARRGYLWHRSALTISCGLLTLTQIELIFPIDQPLHRIGAQSVAAVLFLAAMALAALRASWKKSQMPPRAIPCGPGRQGRPTPYPWYAQRPQTRGRPEAARATDSIVMAANAAP